MKEEGEKKDYLINNLKESLQMIDQKKCEENNVEVHQKIAQINELITDGKMNESIMEEFEEEIKSKDQKIEKLTDVIKH